MLTMGWSDGHTFLPLDFARQFKQVCHQRHEREHRQTIARLQAPSGIAPIGSAGHCVHAGSRFGEGRPPPTS